MAAVGPNSRDNQGNKPIEYTTEFHQIYHELNSDLDVIRHKYPLTTLISIVAFGILGIFNVIRIFSPMAMVAGAVILGLGAALGVGIYKNPSGFWEALKASLAKIKDMALGSETKPQVT